MVFRLDVSVYCAFPSCGHECLKSEMAGHTAQCEFKFTRREASAGVPIPRGRTASMAAPSSALQGSHHPLTFVAKRFVAKCIPDVRSIVLSRARRMELILRKLARKKVRNGILLHPMREGSLALL